jgi:hypothetical protein
MSSSKGNIQCHNCGHLDHYSDRCQQLPQNLSRQRDMCQQPGHYAARCSSQINSYVTPTSIIMCYSCQQPGHFANMCAQLLKNNAVLSLVGNDIAVSSLLTDTADEKLPVYKIGIRFDSYWSNCHHDSCKWKSKECTCTPFGKSAYLHPNCEAFKFKKTFINELISAGYVTDSNIDFLNQIPYISLRKNLEEGDAAYKALDGRVLDITLLSFNIRANSISIDVGMGKHMFIFIDNTGIISRINKNTLITMLTKSLSPYESKEEVSKKSDQKKEYYKICKICMEADWNVYLEPCGHVGLCMRCADNLVKQPNNSTQCPFCRKTISKMKKIFIG